MTLTDLPLTATPTGQAALPDGSDPLHGALVELAACLDAREIETKTLNFARAILRADRVSAWVERDGAFTCWVASGDGAEGVTGATGPVDALERPMEDEDGMIVIVAPLRPTAAATSGALRVARDLAAYGAFSPGERVALTRLADVAGVALRNAERMAANDRTADLELVMEMSRAIGSTLDLDRVMRAVVNLAMRAITFDRGAIALYERGKCDIRALAGVEKFDAEDPELQDLAVRGAWAAGVGEAFYLSDRTEAGSDAERLFLQIFEGDLEADGVVSGLYIPLKDDEGVLGILLFEAERPEFATERQRELATILANQATVALRNAQLYQQVPLADTLGAIHAKKEAFLALPAMRRLTWAVIAAAVIASLTLIQWPLRVEANQPVLSAECPYGDPSARGRRRGARFRWRRRARRARRSASCNCATPSSVRRAMRRSRMRRAPSAKRRQRQRAAMRRKSGCNGCAPTRCGAKRACSTSKFARRSCAVRSRESC